MKRQRKITSPSDFLYDDQGSAWNVGAAPLFLDHPMRHGDSMLIGLRCAVEGFEGRFIAMLDTGSEYFILGGEPASRVLKSLGEKAQEVGRLSCRWGRPFAWSANLEVVLLNDHPNGRDVAFNTSALLVPDVVPFEAVLGVRGCLEHLRLALDLGMRPGESRAYFAPNW